ncbi:MAG TPA: DUF6249 domain-containing protein [Steroidobacteraceae bacterium]|nr:DUF6249 domain-containing protein [Steroidobacteraceae bacterium]
MHLERAVAVAAFWLFVALAAVFGMYFDYRRRKLQVESLRIAAEHGERLDPQLLSRLIAESRPPESESPQELAPYLQIGGIITIASGAGVGLLAFFVAHVWPVALYPTLGAGVLAVCIGIGLLVAARALRKHPIPTRAPDAHA